MLKASRPLWEMLLPCYITSPQPISSLTIRNPAPCKLQLTKLAKFTIKLGSRVKIPAMAEKALGWPQIPFVQHHKHNFAKAILLLWALQSLLSLHMIRQTEGRKLMQPEYQSADGIVQAQDTSDAPSYLLHGSKWLKRRKLEDALSLQTMMNSILRTVILSLQKTSLHT